MKKIVATCFFALMATSFVYAQKISFENLTINYGKIQKGSERVREFIFTNTGTEPLVISNAQGSCGCTVPTWPKEPIMPGGNGKISVNYDTNRLGAFTKYVTLTSNSIDDPNTRLTITGEVLSPENDPANPMPGSK